MELGFICKWSKDREKTWSGTSYGLYKELEKIFDIFDIDAGTTPADISSMLCRVKHKMDRICGKNGMTDMGIFATKVVSPRIRKSLRSKTIPLFMFGEIMEDYPGKKYIYQDLNAGYVKHMYDTNPELFAVSGYQYCTPRSIYKRNEMQSAFYEKVDKIFTMGKWLEKYLVEENHIPNNKVIHVGGGYQFRCVCC